MAIDLSLLCSTNLLTPIAIFSTALLILTALSNPFLSLSFLVFPDLPLLTHDEGPSLETSIFPVSFQVVREPLRIIEYTTYTGNVSSRYKRGGGAIETPHDLLGSKQEL